MPVESVPVAPREVTLMSRADTCVMLTPGTVRRSSAKFWVGALSIVPGPITVIVAGALISFSSVRDAETTTVSSYLAGSCGSLFGSGFGAGLGAVCGSFAGAAGCCAFAAGATAAHSTAARAKRHRAFMRVS